MIPIVEDPNSMHEIRIRMLGNSNVFVTCKCMDLQRSNWKGRTTKTRHQTRLAPEWKSLGDFPVGTPVADLVAAFRTHLSADA